MTNATVTVGLVAANGLALATAAVSVDPILEYLQNGASVGAVMAIFLWREMKRSERYEKLYDEARKALADCEKKCNKCQFVQAANKEFIGEHTTK